MTVIVRTGHGEDPLKGWSMREMGSWEVGVGDGEEEAKELKRRWIPESRFWRRTISHEMEAPA